MYLMPNPDTDRPILLRDPRSMVALPSYGGNCSNTSYWVRRMKDGDAVKTTKEDVAKGVAAADAKAKADAETDAKALETDARLEAEAAADLKDKADKAAKSAATKAAKTTGSRS